jgi:hypothetical protein
MTAPWTIKSKITHHIRATLARPILSHCYILGTETWLSYTDNTCFTNNRKDFARNSMTVSPFRSKLIVDSPSLEEYLKTEIGNTRLAYKSAKRDVMM